MTIQQTSFEALTVDSLPGRLGAIGALAARIGGDSAAWRAASRAAVARVERYYTDTLMFDRYRQVYEGALARNPGAA